MFPGAYYCVLYSRRRTAQQYNLWLAPLWAQHVALGGLFLDIGHQDTVDSPTPIGLLLHAVERQHRG